MTRSSSECVSACTCCCRSDRNIQRRLSRISDCTCNNNLDQHTAEITVAKQRLSSKSEQNEIIFFKGLFVGVGARRSTRNCPSDSTRSSQGRSEGRLIVQAARFHTRHPQRIATYYPSIVYNTRNAAHHQLLAACRRMRLPAIFCDNQLETGNVCFVPRGNPSLQLRQPCRHEVQPA
eukprot:COSAG02_NODE_21964_length_768_cov_0.980568_1_plen_177_part_00